jgi:hypothetical protein
LTTGNWCEFVCALDEKGLSCCPDIVLVCVEGVLDSMECISPFVVSTGDGACADSKCGCLGVAGEAIGQEEED